MRKASRARYGWFFVILAAPDKDGGRNQFLAQHFGEAVQLANKSEAQVLQVVGAEMGIGQKVPAGDQINIISPLWSGKMLL